MEHPASEHKEKAPRRPPTAAEDAEDAAPSAEQGKDAAPSPWEDANKKLEPQDSDTTTHSTSVSDKALKCTEEPARSVEQGKDAAPSRRENSNKKRGRQDSSDATNHSTSVSNPNAAAAAAALLPYDATGKRKKYKTQQTELRQAIAGYFPEGVPMKISHDSTFRQIAGVVQNIRGTTVEIANLTGEGALRQTLPAGTDMGRGNTAVYRAALKFLMSSRDQ